MSTGATDGRAQLEPQQRLRSMTRTYQVVSVLSAVVKVGVAEALADGPLSCEQLAERTGTLAGPLYRALRALAPYQIFEELDDGRFTLTPVADLLRDDAPGSMRASVLMVTADWIRSAWAALDHVLRTGVPAFEHVHGVGWFEYLAREPDAAALFNRAMAARAEGEHHPAAEIYDFSSVSTLVDVGGGHGGILTPILERNPGLRAILFDLPEVVATAGPSFEAAGVAERCTLVGGDFFEAVPSGGDLYLLSRVIHNWDDERASAILKSCRRAIHDDGTLLLLEEIIPPGNDFHPGKLTDIWMLALVGGRERTEAEYRRLLAASGFALTRIMPTTSTISVVEAKPIPWPA